MADCPCPPDDMPEPNWAEAGVQPHDMGDAAKYWGTIVEELRSAGTLALGLRHQIIRLVLAMLLYEDAQAQVNREGAILRAPKTGVPMQHPALSIANKQGQIIAKLEAELGITVTKRAAAAKGKVPGRQRGRKPGSGVEF